ncbi:Replication factor C subunit 4 [Citrus sinensis]|uniref:Replication factor C subunit 4 n=1 Tax=Citrus sinensis TaxID=2711 RepID=A0ACB8KS34_CITSI|nr:Replication factor C subunit 4 [Citrus sinensis]
MLFYGPPGTGKTTTALAIAHQLFGPELYKSRVLELNASDDRGINVVRTKIKTFAAVAVGSGQRRGIIEPLASRCAKFRFKPLSEEVMSSRVLHICNEEGLNLDAEALSTLSSISQGDLRRAITYLQPMSNDEAYALSFGEMLQGAARLFGSSITSKDLISVSGTRPEFQYSYYQVIPPEVVEGLFAVCRSGDFDLANKEVNNIIAEGYPASLLLSQLFDVVVETEDISDEQKARICKCLAEVDKCLVDGADEYLQLLDVASNVIRAVCNMPEEFQYDC